MPPSQLKRLKSSLREQGITGPAKSKKQKKADKGGKDGNERIQRHVALQQIRNSFNPYEIKAPSRPAKFEHTTLERGGKKASYRDVLQRPGASKSAGEEMRRATLLPEMQRRNNVGGLIDRRIGEGDPGMTAEERAMERFALEKSRKRGANVFDLDASDDDEPKISLTHGGRRLDDLPADDFGSISGGDESDLDVNELFQRKRGRDPADDHAADAHNADEPERKKSKKEVMQEVMAKSKLYKYERQKAKEDDDDIREELDKGMHDVLALLRGQKVIAPPAAPTSVAAPAPTSGEPAMNPDRQRLLDGADRSKVDKEYDARLKQLAQDARAKPSERTKTEEEKAVEDAERLRRLEERRTKRMRGEAVSDDERDDSRDQPNGGEVGGDDDVVDDVFDEAEEFGFANSDAAPKPAKQQQLVLDDEDEFALDEDLVASGSEVDLSSESASEDGSDSDESDVPDIDDEEDEFVKDILGDAPAKTPTSTATAVVKGSALKYTYPCPQTHEELLDAVKDSPVQQLPTVIQRIRALHHPSLSAGNKEAMAVFSTVLVDHLAYMGAKKHPLATVEQVVRHLHSLSRTYPEDIANSFRRHLADLHERKDVNAGDLVVLTAIGSIYPTSDHFHQVVTPAMTLMARWLGLNAPDTPHKSKTGAFLVALSLKYQALSKRYIPEAVRFTLRALSQQPDPDAALADSHVANLVTLANLWQASPSLPETLQPFLQQLRHAHRKAHQTVSLTASLARQRRRPLQLHQHRRLAIRASQPKFEEGYAPGRHYDADAERAAAARLRREHRRERKAAVRELRKDAHFVARHQLADKRARDADYERKYRRLVAEVQGEEGHAAKEYERERAGRKRRAG